MVQSVHSPGTDQRN